MDVLVVGGGPVGLALAIELGRRGVDTLVIDPAAHPPPGPRAQLLNIRTMEHLRRWGIADAVREAAVYPDGWPYEVVYCTNLTGDLLVRFPAFTESASGQAALSPEGPQRIPQFLTSRVLRAHAEALPSVTTWWEREATGVSQDGEGATTQVRDGRGRTTTVRSRFVVGCDGARSLVRDAVGTDRHGPGQLSQQLGIFFRSPDLADHLAVGKALMYLVVDARTQGLLGTVDGTSWWYQAGGYPPEVDLATVDLDAILRAAIGVGPAPDGPTIEITGTQPWAMHHLVADRYRDDRLFLAGDAAHLFPPTGGHNLNTGIQDAVDLGWKLAATIDGWGGPALLESYDQERRPVADRGATASSLNATRLREAIFDALVSGATTDDERGALGERMRAATRLEWSSIGVVLGYRYEGSPILVPDGSPEPADAADHYLPVVRPGHRAPHVALADGSSLLDRFGTGFSLVVAEDAPRRAGPTWTDAASRMGVPFGVVTPAPADRATVTSAYGGRSCLVRPDGHVAWCGPALGDDPADVLAVATGHR